MAGIGNNQRLRWDAFLSYRHQEPAKSWVRKVLAPALEAAGVRVLIDYRDFRLGAPIVSEMAGAVEQSRYTAAVLTPPYLESGFTDLEAIMAEHLGLETKASRLILISREACKPRLDLRARLWLDMTSDADFEDNIARLASELLRPETALA